MVQRIQYTIRNIPPAIDAKLRAQASSQGISLNKLLLKKLGAHDSRVGGRTKTYHDLDWMIGSIPLEETRLIDAAIKESREADKRRAYTLYQSELNR